MPGEPTRIVDASQIRSYYNDTGATLPVGRSVMLDSTEHFIKLPTATTDRLNGVTMAAIPDDEWGDIQIGGVALVAAHAALATPGVALMSTAATGRCTTFAAGAGVNAQLVGQLRTTAGAQDDLVEVELASPGALQQG